MTLRLGRTWVVLAMLAALIVTGFADTYHLSAENSWQNVADSPESEYLLAVSKIKQQLLTGTKSDVIDALEQLKSDFPDMTGDEIEAYLEAEKLYAKAKWHKAATVYKKFIDTWPDSVLRPAAMERVYSIATAYLQGQKRRYILVLNLSAFDTGAELMLDIAEKAGTAPIALRALTTLAENQEREERFIEAFDTWQMIADGWETGQIRKTAILRMAKAKHASYDGTQYDATALEEARWLFEDYKTNPYTNDAEQQEADKTIALITEQLAYKEYETGIYYERTENPDVANKYYQKILRDSPDSKAARMAQARMAPDAVSPIRMTARRRVVDGATQFLDSWFFMEPLFKPKDKKETQE
ncbi:MAG: outer membrane protein assembly factor BamD [Planctomycetota bacterium]